MVLPETSASSLRPGVRLAESFVFLVPSPDASRTLAAASVSVYSRASAAAAAPWSSSRSSSSRSSSSAEFAKFGFGASSGLTIGHSPRDVAAGDAGCAPSMATASAKPSPAAAPPWLASGANARTCPLPFPLV
eukprot:CAMPEP_0181393776 /NCGR_PEP_ID=MMETSP1106-20121128/27376_1 /TAXON_ID=81844 /ORGANISM="Mantoniella antarctica, Strain SL-175" /LENGTH=132 /DNA_ID=CAMNT_0023515131 /DNA_START=1377 /DNA_END=1775 /DNA_ORIENTATION=-